jgi:acetyltransferase-like isoleucine patch superfamily enzyme
MKNGKFAFQMYFYLERLLWGLCDVMPPPLRMAFLRLAFKRLAKGSIVDYGVYVRYPWKVSIGKCSVLNRGCRLYSSYQVRDAEIIIGDHVAVGPDVVFCGAGHDHTTLDLVDLAATIRIDDHAWIGARSVLLPGIIVGKGAVVGAGSVVTGEVSPWTIVAGNPARLIKQRTLASGSDDAPQLGSTIPSDGCNNSCGDSPANRK